MGTGLFESDFWNFKTYFSYGSLKGASHGDSIMD
jgi:hypothetical protein